MGHQRHQELCCRAACRRRAERSYHGLHLCQAHYDRILESIEQSLRNNLGTIRMNAVTDGLLADLDARTVRA